MIEDVELENVAVSFYLTYHVINFMKGVLGIVGPFVELIGKMGSNNNINGSNKIKKVGLSK